MQYTEISSAVILKISLKKKMITIFNIFAQNNDCVYTLEPPRGEAVLTSTHTLCFG